MKIAWFLRGSLLGHACLTRSGHGCPCPNACFSKVSRACPKFLTRDVDTNDPGRPRDTLSKHFLFGLVLRPSQCPKDPSALKCYGAQIRSVFCYRRRSVPLSCLLCLEKQSFLSPLRSVLLCPFRLCSPYRNSLSVALLVRKGPLGGSITEGGVTVAVQSLASHGIAFVLFWYCKSFFGGNSKGVSCYCEGVANYCMKVLDVLNYCKIPLGKPPHMGGFRTKEIFPGSAKELGGLMFHSLHWGKPLFPRI